MLSGAGQKSVRNKQRVVAAQWVRVHRRMHMRMPAVWLRCISQKSQFGGCLRPAFRDRRTIHTLAARLSVHLAHLLRGAVAYAHADPSAIPAAPPVVLHCYTVASWQHPTNAPCVSPLTSQWVSTRSKQPVPLSSSSHDLL